MEGFAGDLRVGLPWQSVHDGTNYQHEPQRLNVIIEAPVDEMSKILDKHESIRQLCDNNWIYLFAMNDQGKVAYKYIGDLVMAFWGGWYLDGWFIAKFVIVFVLSGLHGTILGRLGRAEDIPARAFLWAHIAGLALVALLALAKPF